MPPLPNAIVAILDIRKIEEYCLNLMHPRGRHKARVFRDALGLTREDAGWLRQELLAGLQRYEAVELPSDDFGRRWRADIPVTRQERRAVVRTLWMERSGEHVPRFVTCWVL